MAKNKRKNKSSYLITILLILGFLTIFTWIITQTDLAGNTQSRPVLLTPTPTLTPIPLPTFTPTPIPTPVILQTVNYSVPFTSQAPSGQWSDSRFQDGCEEASSLMAMKWVRGETFTPGEAERELIQMAAFQDENYYTHVDTSAQDTIDRIFVGYLMYNQVELKTVNSWQDIAEELVGGNLVITPANGQLLNNPNFTPPGPERHMVLVIGYDSQTQEFVTNDPGTRKGANFRYPVLCFYNAIRDYKSGEHLPIMGNSKVMIVVSK